MKRIKLFWKRFLVAGCFERLVQTGRFCFVVQVGVDQVRFIVGVACNHPPDICRNAWIGEE